MKSVVSYSQKRYTGLLLVIALMTLSSCATYSRKANSVRDALIAGQLDAAYAMLQDRSNSDPVLNNMNKGMVLRLKGQSKASNQALDIAKKRIEELYGVSVSEQLGSVAINDGVVEYSGARYERLLLHAFMAMNYIEQGDLDAARVEMLQADVKMREWGETPDDDPFLRYLAGLIFEALGEYDEAVIAFRHSIEAYKLQQDRQKIAIPKVVVSDTIRIMGQQGFKDEAKSIQDEFKDRLDTPSKPGATEGQLVVLLNNGLAPIKSEHSINLYADEIAKSVRIALPSYPKPVKQLNDARLMIDDKIVPMPFETVENIDALARTELESDMAAITARALARAVVKHHTQQKAKDRNELGGFLMTMTNLATERADTRSWVTLPQEIEMTRISLPEGKHRVNLQILNKAGFVIDQFEEEVEIKPGKISFVFKHWFAPRPKPAAKPTQNTSRLDALDSYEPERRRHV